MPARTYPSTQASAVPPMAASTMQSVVAALRAAFPLALGIYAFGSRARGDALPGSDLDLALLVPGYADVQQMWTASGELADQLGFPVDLLDLRAASTIMQAQVLEQGTKLWSLEPQAGLFECFVAAEKIALNQARSGLLADIGLRGTVYGR